jgi:hypothetical protein
MLKTYLEHSDVSGRVGLYDPANLRDTRTAERRATNRNGVDDSWAIRLPNPIIEFFAFF